jgi:hypothetical protein
MSLQRFSFTLKKLVKSRMSFIFKIKIPSKTVLHLIIMQVMNWLGSLNVNKSINFSSICNRSTNYSLLRSPFVFKKSQEQLSFNHYIGSFAFTIYNNSSLVCEYIRLFLLTRVQTLSLSVIKIYQDSTSLEG